METWERIDGYDHDYRVSNLGNVVNWDTGTRLSTESTDRNGNRRVTLRRNRNKIRISLSNLVAERFVDNSGGGHLVGFRDGDRSNVLSSNLYWYSIERMERGEVHGNFTVVEDLGKVDGFHKVRVRCICGNERVYTYSVVNRKVKNSCGCIRSPLPKIKPLDLEEANKRDIGDWKIIEEVSRSRDKKGNIVRMVTVQCACGYKKKVKYRNVKLSKSCYDCAIHKINNRYTEQERKIRKSLRERLSGMKQRCYKEDNKSYRYYGAKGIRICDQWLESTESFIQWSLSNGFEMGLEIDREDPSGDYCPDNCRYITKELNLFLQNNRK